MRCSIGGCVASPRAPCSPAVFPPAPMPRARAPPRYSPLPPCPVPVLPRGVPPCPPPLRVFPRAPCSPRYLSFPSSALFDIELRLRRRVPGPCGCPCSHLECLGAQLSGRPTTTPSPSRIRVAMALVSRNSGGDEDAIFMASRSQDSCPSPGQGSSPQIQYPQRQSSNMVAAPLHSQKASHRPSTHPTHSRRHTSGTEMSVNYSRLSSSSSAAARSSSSPRRRRSTSSRSTTRCSRGTRGPRS